jgi:catechol 2,3-dioxygenase-like lactoylglutathione lyase family enzyme
MRINHVGLNIKDEEEIIDFYQNILGFHSKYQFDISNELGVTIFGENKEVKVFLIEKEDLLLELFVHPLNFNRGFSHICIEIKDRENIVSKCENKGYNVIRIKRNNRPDMLFINDELGNVFELKEGNL